MADKLEIIITDKGTSVRCPALYKTDVPTVSCVNDRSHCDFYCDLQTNRRGTRHFIICKYREKASPRTRSIFGHGKAITPKELMITKGENLEWLENELGVDVKNLQEISRKLMEKARRQSR